jgi:hypothetical protein
LLSMGIKKKYRCLREGYICHTQNDGMNANAKMSDKQKKKKKTEDKKRRKRNVFSRCVSRS